MLCIISENQHLLYSYFSSTQDFLTNLVCNLLDEGNTLFEEREWDQAVKEFSEGLNVSEYAAAEEIHIPEALLESLYVNRATAYYTMGEYDQGVADCDEALEVCKESYRALYRKALCLKELGKHKEAYNCTTECLLINRLDKPVNDLAQELAVHLGLKNRKPYVSAKVRQMIVSCFLFLGEGIYTFVHKPDLVHNCKRDILLCRYKASFSSAWTRVRPIPNCPAFAGPFVLCKELQKSGDKGLCKYGEMCTFAFNPLEIDVWTLERKGLLDRRLLFEPSSAKQDPINSIIRLLKDHKGMFIFLCQACYDGKPTIISKRSKDNHTICSNTNARHIFDANKCLAFVIKTPSVRYRKVRPLSVLCCLDLCHHNIRYGCLKENNCQFAHSDIELKTWRVQRDTGMSVGGGRSKARGGGAETSLDMRMRFACSLCWPGRISEPDKALKYCTAKAKHTWTKDRRVLLVLSLERSKWVMVRPLPHSKNFPVQYDICTQILDKGKCNYIGNCTFAHSQEEKKMWMYMKNNDCECKIVVLLCHTNRQTNGSVLTQSVPEEKFIVMPTDYAEPMSGFHCELCGKHSNSERQWQKHISTEKHKDRVFSCEGQDESLTWNYRFPAKNFELCPKLNGDCPDGVCCDYAHSPEELQEWIERRDLLRHKLAKARKDMLIMPHESDFGKYNFLLQD
uniref:Zinc finger CCCH domain-containing protein 7B-like n=1 Tax=Sphaeramia orbicularis TaxID=375764 RepID=A0A672Z8B6_9TELE